MERDKRFDKARSGGDDVRRRDKPAIRPTAPMQKFICIHGHFYQPPRENAWLEAVEVQDSAFPYHDWNERITAECYAPNATARIMDPDGRIARLINNYARINFNYGPTLLAWMQQKAVDIHDAIIQADQESGKRFSGHGSAIAQAYNHMIMPLANDRDRRTQVLWGIQDFQHRFGRMPEGMWLPETAADTPTLEALAEQGLRFTILSPYQASRTRRLGTGKWRDVTGGKVDPSMPYTVKLPSGRQIAVFFYDGPISRAVAFEQLLGNGQHFAGRLLEAFDDRRTHDQLVHIATDGESYGHHHRQGEMALAYALEHIETEKLARLTNYGEFLALNPPTHEAGIHEKSSWSCAHGVDRWWRDCGCNSGGHPGWNQGWRTPLRESLDWLRDALIPRYEEAAGRLLKDPWAARDGYISLILDRSAENQDQFFERHAKPSLSGEERFTALKLLEMQHHTMLMYTSCGWFFDELSGIETVQIIQYAGRAIQLADSLGGESLEPGFLGILERAQCNVREHQNGRVVYEKFVKPAIMDRVKVGAHFAVSSLFENYPEHARIYVFTVEQRERELLTAGNSQLGLGHMKVTHTTTRGTDHLTYCVLHFGDHNINGGVRRFRDPEAYEQMKAEISEAFSRADFPEVIRLMDRHFEGSHYSLKSLFRDEQRRILNQILRNTLADVEKSYRQITNVNTPLMRFLADLGAPLPRALEVAEGFVINAELREQFASDQPDLERILALLKNAGTSHVDLEADDLTYALKGTLDRLLEDLTDAPADMTLLQRIKELAGILPLLPFEVNLWKTQNLYYDMLNSVFHGFQNRAIQGVPEAQNWVHSFLSLGDRLGFQTSTYRNESQVAPSQ